MSLLLILNNFHTFLYRFFCWLWTMKCSLKYTFWAQELSWTYVRCSEDVLNIFWTSSKRSFTRLIYIYVIFTSCVQRVWSKYVMRCAIWYHLCYLKNVKNTHGGGLILVKLQAEACNFIKISTSPWVFFMFFKLYKWHQIAQRTTYENMCAITSTFSY